MGIISFMRGNNDISIALCTHNGALFLNEQLNSLFNQSCKPKEIVIFDDCSTDKTIKIIESFSKKGVIDIRLIKNDKKVGPVLNFSHAMMACSSNYIALSDQDDVWKENKLEITLRKMKEMETIESPGCPLLVHGDLIVTNENLMPLTFSMMRKQGLKNEEDMQQAQRVLAVQNYVTGCTVMINKKLRDIACPIPPEAVMHDWWLALIAANKGKIGFIKEPLIYYRQHNNNTVGAVINKWKRHIHSILQYRIIKDKLLAILTQNLVAKECRFSQKIVNAVMNGDLISAWKLGIKRQSFSETLGLYFVLWIYNEDYKYKLSTLHYGK